MTKYLSYSDKIREIISSMIEVDTLNDENNDIQKRKINNVVKNDKVIYTAPPKIRAPRRKPSFKNKWNADSKKDLMRDYMKEYRSTGRDIETGNRYIKKLKE
jgi:hypothetical protein